MARKRKTGSNIGGRGRAAAFLVISLMATVLTVAVMFGAVSRLSTTIAEPIEACAKRCHPFAPDVKYGECFCDEESRRPR